MAKIIRFPLKMKSGEECRTLDELRENFDLESVLGYFMDGKLKTWLSDRYYDEKATAVAALSAEMPDLKAKLCEILEVEYDSHDDSFDISMIQKRKKKLHLLQTMTDDQELIANCDIVALSQEELIALLQNGAKEVYLYGKLFEIPLNYRNVKYVGFNNPLIVIKSEDNCDFKSKNLSFTNSCFAWDSTVVSEKDEVLLAESLIINNQWEKAIPILTKYAEMDHPRALFLLEHIYSFYAEDENLRKKYLERLHSIDSLYWQNTDIQMKYIEIIKQFASSGTSFDKCYYAQIMLYGWNTKRFQPYEIQKALQNCNNPWVAYILSECYRYKNGPMPYNVEKRLHLLEVIVPCRFLQAIKDIAYIFWEYKYQYVRFYVWKQGKGEMPSPPYSYAQCVNNEFKYTLEAARCNSSESALKVAEFYAEGPEIYDKDTTTHETDFIYSKDLQAAFSWYKKSAEMGNARAMIEVGECFLKGKGIKQSTPNAIEWYNKALNAGYDSALSRLAFQYQLDDDFDTAIMWYKKSLQSGCKEAYLDIAECYKKKGDDAQCIEWMKKAAEAGCEDAYRELGRYYKQEKVYPEAIRYFQKAFEICKSNEKSKMNSCKKDIAKCYVEMKQYPNALSIYMELSEAGENSVLDNIGDCYKVMGNLTEAMQYYQKAIAAEYYSAMCSIGEIYEEQGDYDNAEIWYKQAAAHGVFLSSFRLRELEFKREHNGMSLADALRSMIDE